MGPLAGAGPRWVCDVYGGSGILRAPQTFQGLRQISFILSSFDMTDEDLMYLAQSVDLATQIPTTSIWKNDSLLALPGTIVPGLSDSVRAVDGCRRRASVDRRGGRP